MKYCAQFLTSLYGRLLALYPRRYRGEYGDELRTVFSIAAGEAAEDGLPSLLSFGLHELRDLLAAALYQHMKERKRLKVGDDTGELLAFRPANWREISLAAAPFLYFGLIFYSLTNGLLVDGPRWIREGAALGMLALMVGLVLVGLYKGFPHWSLPTIGLLFVPALFMRLLLFSRKVLSYH